jgi:UrcA family protein
MNTNKIPVSFTRKASFGAVLLSLSVIASAAIAGQSESPSQSRSAAVSLAGLDLATPAGMAAAQERVHQTARRLCFQLSDAADLSRQPNYVRCVDEAVASAMLQISGSVPGLVAQSTSGQHIR